MDHKFYLIDDLFFTSKDAGFKARKDVISILEKKDDVKVYKYYSTYKEKSTIRIKRIVDRLIMQYINRGAFKNFLINRTTSQDTLFFQYPFESTDSRQVFDLINQVKRTKNFQIVMLIHDINSIRKKDDSLLADELFILSSADKIVAHNRVMKAWLISKGIDANKISSLEIFDYLCQDTQPDATNLSSERKVMYAGTLTAEKSGFIYQWKPNYNVSLYGVGLDKEKFKDSNRIAYFGSFNPNEPKLDTSGIIFGLIWDGSSSLSCEGHFGEYLKFNTPHKSSLYLSQGIPVIIWKQAAIADFITENNLGFAIDSLEEIDSLLNNIDLASYNTIKENVSKVRLDLINGNRLLSSINKN